MTFQIRRVNGLHYQSELYHMQEVCFPGYDLVCVHVENWWIAFGPEDEPAGFACLSRDGSSETRGYLAYAGVMPKFRGKGLQRRLIQVRINRARKLGMNLLVSDTTHNPHSTNNLIACGFRAFHPKHPWGLPAAVYWKLDL